MDSAKFVWMDGEMVPFEDATVHVLSNALHYGTGVFEGIRAYETPEGTAIFRLTEHIDRLARSAKAYGIPMTRTVPELIEVCREVMAANELESGYVRPLVFYELGSIGLNPAAARVRTIVAAWRWGAYLGDEGVAKGIRVRVSSWRRIHQSSFVPTAKGTGQYLNSVLAKQEALGTGYDEALLLNMDGNVSEGSGENLFLVRDDAMYTPPISSGILDGITRASVMKLLADDGVEVKEATLTRGDLYGADELFLTGTAAEVTPIREVDDRPVGAGEPGPVTKRAQDLFKQAVTGKLPAYQSWLTLV
ncbi:MAG: branched-chain amino acid transaminase [Actinomycetota bacterium]